MIETTMLNKDAVERILSSVSCIFCYCGRDEVKVATGLEESDVQT